MPDSVTMGSGVSHAPRDPKRIQGSGPETAARNSELIPKQCPEVKSVAKARSMFLTLQFMLAAPAKRSAWLRCRLVDPARLIHSTLKGFDLRRSCDSLCSRRLGQGMKLSEPYLEDSTFMLLTLFINLLGVSSAFQLFLYQLLPSAFDTRAIPFYPYYQQVCFTSLPGFSLVV